MTRLVAHGLSECAETFFFLSDCVFFTPKSTTTDISFESKFAAAMLCFIHDDCVSFRWRGFSRGWLWVSLSFCHRTCSNTGCTADIGCLFIHVGSMSVVQRRHWCWCGTELLEKTRGAFHTHDPRQLIFQKLLFDSISWLGHRLLWTRPLRPWLHICTSHSPMCAFYLFLFLECGQHVSTRTRRISQTCLGFVFHHSCSCVVDAEIFVHLFRLYTFFYCMESRVLVLLVSHSLAGWVIVGFMRSDFFHRVASLLQWDGMLIWDVTLVHTLSFEWMVVGNIQDFAKIALQAVCSTLGKTRCVAIVAPPTHTFRFQRLTVCVCTCQFVRLVVLPQGRWLMLYLFFEVQRSW